MKTGCHCEKIKRHACQETNEQQANAGNTKRQPKQEKKINIGSNKPVKVRNLIQYIDLHYYEQSEADNISEKVTQRLLFFGSSIFFFVSFISLSWSS